MTTGLTQTKPASDANRPDFTNAAYSYMASSWQRTRDVWGGVRSIRESSVEYLTKFTRESPDDYKSRRLVTEFYNVFGHTVDGIVGMICRRDIAPQEAPTGIAELLTDIDLCGNDLAAFLRRTVTNAVRDGHSFIFVDAPPPVRKEDGTRPTLADVEDRRVWWVNYEASQLKNWQYTVVNGKLVITLMTFKETTLEADGLFGEKQVTRYRVLRPGSFELWEEDATDKSKIVLVAQESRGFVPIPVAVLYTRKTAPLESAPPFLDLLETNITHYNSQSILREALKYIVPMPVFRIASEADLPKFKEMAMASNRSVIMWGENTDAKYLELEGKSIEELRIDIENLETRMAKLGIEKFAPQSDNNTKTATEINTDNEKEMSEAAVWAANLENTVEQAFYFTAELTNSIKGAGYINLGDAEKSKLKLNIEYDKLTYSMEQLQFLNQLMKDGIVSRLTFLEVLPRIMSMPKGFNPSDEIERIIEEREGKSAISDLDKRIEQANKLEGIVSHREQLKLIYPERSDAEIQKMLDEIAKGEAVRQAAVMANG